MPWNVQWKTSVSEHPGSSAAEIKNEPGWSHLHEHRVGFKNRQNRRPGLTHDGDESRDNSTPGLTDSSTEPSDEEEYDHAAREKFLELKEEVEDGKLINFRDAILHQDDVNLIQPDNRSLGWRYVLDTSEDWIKNQEHWPANIKRKKEEAEKQKSKKDKDKEAGTQKSQKDGNEEHDWRKKHGDSGKHHDAYAEDSTAARESQNDEDKSMNTASHPNKRDSNSETYHDLLERYSPQEIALLRSLNHEKEYRTGLRQNNGKRRSPQTHNRTTIAIDEQDQFSPDNWLPRSDHLIRLTGKHPLNAESELTTLFNGGLITPNELHYVRNHGAVPRLLWEYHKLDVESGRLVLSMDDLKTKFESINIPVTLACDGNRRKELNMLKRSKGFNWGAGATGCVYWKGPLLCDVLRAAGVKTNREAGISDDRQRWVNFEGADEPSEGKYQTCIPLDYAMDPTNDVILPFEMNDSPLPPDHGYPVRLLVPGYVGGRCVKWLSRIWISDKENDSHYHIWDNRVLPSFITEKDGDFARAMFAHPDTACNEQNLNSVICKPAHGEKIDLSEARKGKTYRIGGYAYDGGGHEVQRIEISLDGGRTWLYCIRTFPEYPIRHGNKFWTWLHWHVEVSIVQLLQSKSIAVRAWNVFKNTQPEHASWNVMGMMNNCWYQVKPEICLEKDSTAASIVFRHPVEPGTADGGWMKPSVENQIASVKQSAGTPQKQFTREEIEKHDREDDCWLVVNSNVYDATSVIAWHPGGKAAITTHAGKVHQETSDEFASVHDDFAYQKLNECILGTVTDKAADYIKASAEALAREKAQSANESKNIVLQKHKWVPVTLTSRKELSEDTRQYTFQLPHGVKDLGLGTCQHVQIGFHLKDKMLIRSYTPSKPLLPDIGTHEAHDGPEDKRINTMADGEGSFELVVKTYFPDSKQPGGAMSNILDCLPMGGQVEIRGPTGEIVYRGQGQFEIQGEKLSFRRISLVLGGSGITPGYALIVRALLSEGDETEIRVIDANRTEKDILLRKEMDDLERDFGGRLKIMHVLSHPNDEWQGEKGHVDAEKIKKSLFPPADGAVCFLCGPPAMIQKAALPALRDWGYVEDTNIFGF